MCLTNIEVTPLCCLHSYVYSNFVSLLYHTIIFVKAFLMVLRLDRYIVPTMYIIQLK